MYFSFFLDTVNFSFDNFKEHINNVNNKVLIIPFYFNYKNNNMLFFNKNLSTESIFNGILKYLSNTEFIATVPHYDEEKRCYTGKIITNLNETKKTEKFLIVENLFHKILLCFIYDIKEFNISEVIKEFNISTFIVFNPFPFSLNNNNVLNILKQISYEHNTISIFVTPLGLHKTFIFDGTLIIFEKGKLINKTFLQPFFNFYEERKSIIESNNIKTIYDILVFGIKEFFKINNLNKAVIGVSGGVDSAIVTTLAATALGNKNVLGLVMPSSYTSNSSIIDATNLCKNIGIQYHIIPITRLYRTYLEELSSYTKDNNTDISEENLQARIRMIILMWFSNKFGYTVLNTSNKSEIATGYGTIYGDISGALSVIGDLYKTQVYELANFINNNHEIIPFNIIKKEPSAELKENQKDSDTLPPYHILDKILYELLENEKRKEDLIINGFNEEMVNKTIELINKNRFKKQYLPPILKISTKTFNIDIID